MRYFETNTLVPFAVYCLVAGLACTLYFAPHSHVTIW